MKTHSDEFILNKGIDGAFKILRLTMVALSCTNHISSAAETEDGYWVITLHRVENIEAAKNEIIEIENMYKPQGGGDV